MTRKLSAELVHDAKRLFMDGCTVAECATAIGVSPGVLGRRLREIGVDTSRNARKRPGPNAIELSTDSVCSMYEDGMSENAVAKHFGVSRSVIRRHLKDGGAHIRNQSESEALKWSQMTGKKRRDQVANAHKARTGSFDTYETRIARAKAREEMASEHHIGIGEPEFAQFLRDIGRPFTHQKAVDVHNIDFAIGSVAVELTASTKRYCLSNTSQNERAKKLAEFGYKTLAVAIDNAEALLACAEDVLAFVDELDCLEPVFSEYWVIRCRRKDYTIGTNERGQITSEPAPVHFVNERKTIQFGS